RPVAQNRPGHRYRLYPARHPAAGRGAQPRAAYRRRAGHAAAPGRAGLCRLVRHDAQGDPCPARPDRSDAGRLSMWTIGITGSIATGKSTLLEAFGKCGVPVFSADKAVAELYAGEAVAPVEALFPGVAGDGAIDRAELARRLA